MKTVNWIWHWRWKRISKFKPKMDSVRATPMVTPQMILSRVGFLVFWIARPWQDHIFHPPTMPICFSYLYCAPIIERDSTLKLLSNLNNWGSTLIRDGQSRLMIDMEFICKMSMQYWPVTFASRFYLNEKKMKMKRPKCLVWEYLCIQITPITFAHGIQLRHVSRCVGIHIHMAFIHLM